jgi:hypothetical protein
MPPRDIYHHAVTQALLKDGWTITHDPFPIVVVATEREEVVQWIR